MSEVTTAVNVQNQVKRNIFVPAVGQFIEMFVNNTNTRAYRKFFGSLAKVEIPKDLPESNTVVRFIHSFKEIHDMWLELNNKENPAEIIGKTTLNKVKESFSKVSLTEEQRIHLDKHKELFGVGLNKFGEYAVYDHEERKCIVYTEK